LGQLGEEPCASAFFYLGDKSLHGLRRYLASFAAGQRGARVVKRGQKLDAAAFAFFPQSERL
jgi:hypothetical protein